MYTSVRIKCTSDFNET